MSGLDAVFVWVGVTVTGVAALLVVGWLTGHVTVRWTGWRR